MTSLRQIRGWILLLLMALPAMGALAVPASKEKANMEPIEPEARRLINEMGNYLREAKYMSFSADINFDDVLASGQKISFAASTQFRLKRPNGIFVDQQAEVGHKLFWFDGQSIRLYEPETGNFAEEALKGNSDKALEFTINQLKFSPPLADFLTSDPAKTLLKSVVKGFVVGPSSVNGTPCRHLAFLDRLIDWQIWIEEGKLPLPRKLLITYKTLPNSPQYTATLSDFDLISRLPDSLFNPQIPPSAVRLPFLKASHMRPNAKGKSASREGAAP